MSNNCTLNCTGVSNNEELRDVDHCGEETAKRNHQPHVCWSLVQSWEFIRPRNYVEEDDSSKGCLVEEELEAVDFVFSLVGAYPHGVDATNCHTTQCDKDAETANSFNRYASYGGRFLIVVGDERDAEAHGNEGVGCCSGDGFLVENEIYDSDARSEEDAGNLVEGNC